MSGETGPRRVLLVDDEPDIREIARLSLENVGGWQVTTAASGVEALALTRESRFDAVLLDVMMPDLDGPATLARLREEGLIEGVPVIFLTAKVQAADRRQLDALGAAGTIGKPFDPMRLSDEVARVLSEDAARSAG
ncbi:MAG TPA: response regulator [Solirubrobacteraceae bacterium]|nr:response regulator [Solirubrobacteraceae bacterium]